MNLDEAKQVIGEVLKLLDISRVVCVDDAYARNAGIQDASAMIEALLILQRYETCLACFDGDVPFQPDNDEWRGILGQVWESTPARQAEWLRRLYLGLDEDNKLRLDQPSSFVAASTLREILRSVGVAFTELTPSDWLKRQAAILEQAKVDEKILILFDHHLHNDPNYPSKDPGTKLMGKVLAQPNPGVLCGLLSGKFSVGQERAAGRTYAPEVGQPLSRWLPISKHRLDAAELFAEGVKATVVNYVTEQLVDRAIDISYSALAESDKSLRQIEAYDLHQVVVESSRYEAVWEIDTLFRLLNVFLTNEINRGRGKDRATLDSLTDLIHRLDAVRSSAVATPTAEVRRIRRLELYDTEFLNLFHATLRLGDVFRIGQKDYILLAQPCDLMVREGSRRPPVVPLVRIKRQDKKLLATQAQAVQEIAAAQAIAEPAVPVILQVPGTESATKAVPAVPIIAQVLPGSEGITAMQTNETPDEREHILKPIYHYYADEEPTGVVNLKDTIYLPTSVLDLAVFHEDGTCSIDVDIIIPAGLEGLIGPWRQHYDVVRKEFKELATNIEALRGNKLSGEIRQRLEKAVLGRYRPKGVNAVEFTQAKNDGPVTAVKFPIARIDHYKEPWSTVLLQQFTAYLGRPALEHDFADQPSR